MNKVSDGLAWRALAFGVLAACAAIYTFDDGSDAFQHFLHSVTYVSELNIRNFVLSVWDKPLPILIYGISGVLGGINGARLASVLLVVMSAGMVHSLARRCIRGAADAPYESMVLFLMVMPVFLQSFITMTELIAGFVLVSALYLYYVMGRPWLACLVAGVLPLARVEAGLFLAVMLGFFLFLQWRCPEDRDNRRLLGMVVFASLPCLIWFSACWIYSGDFFYVAHNGYTFARPFDAELFAVHNGITALPSVLTPPALLLVLFGVFSIEWRTVVSGREDGGFLFICVLIMFVFLVFTATVIAYPRNELHWELLIPVVNGRAYNVVAPVLAIFAYLGLARLSSAMEAGAEAAQAGRGEQQEARFLLVVFLLGLCVVYLCKKQFYINGSAFSRAVPAYLWLYVSFFAFLLSGFLSQRVRRFLWPASVLFVVLSFLVINPRFYGPTRFSDPNFKLQTELTNYVSAYYGGESTLLLQNLSGSVEYFIGKKEIQAGWQWPTRFVEQANGFQGKVLVLIRTDGEARTPSAVYDSTVTEFAQSLREVRRSTVSAPEGWVLYEAK
ncbi:hypothetical protein LLG90_08375 [Aromatoleum toluclasticum]|uniref:hypothetical protein n=1 Tax=Aromatoleum toluclasticum TaxID=92003 RepID=UPI001D18223F|nr:hypothetical protein [Aromatoleum toluclasticum]MCC4115360.1 hypothetical protein [Aromatoleum toluclasticum]